MYLFDMVNTPFPTFEVPKVREDFFPLATGLQQFINVDILCNDVHASISLFNTEQRHVFDNFTGSILLCVTLSIATHKLPSPLQLAITYSVFSSSSIPFASISFVYSRSSSSSYEPVFGDLDVTGKLFVTRAIKGFLPLWKRNFIAVAT